MNWNAEFLFLAPSAIHLDQAESTRRPPRAYIVSELRLRLRNLFLAITAYSFGCQSIPKTS
jgi:hypothetical protein